MDTFPEALLLFAAIFLGSIPAIAFLIHSRSIRRRQRARLWVGGFPATETLPNRNVRSPPTMIGPATGASNSTRS